MWRDCPIRILSRSGARQIVEVVRQRQPTRRRCARCATTHGASPRGLRKHHLDFDRHPIPLLRELLRKPRNGRSRFRTCDPCRVNEPESVANDSQTSSFNPTIRNYSSAPDEASHAFPAFTAVFKNLGKKTVQDFRGRLEAHSDVERLLTVREVAQCLSVSTATVYALCARRELAHVRISNAIRIVPTELESFLLQSRRRP